MASVVLYGPHYTPVTVDPNRSISHEFVAWNGDTWDMRDPAGGFVFTGDDSDLRGVDIAESFTSWTSDSPGTPGVRYRGGKFGAREVYWPAAVMSDNGSEAWVALDSKVRRALNPKIAGTWKVTAPGQATRYLRIRFESRTMGYTRDPAWQGFTKYGLTWQADWPFWQGETTTLSWDGSGNDKSNWLSPGTGFVYWLNSSYTAASATVTNPGDEETYPVWRVYAPFTTASVGWNGVSVEIPFSMSSGFLTIDTYRKTAVTDAGVLRTKDLGSAGFTSIPAGAEVPLDIAITATGRIEMDLTPNYWGAW